MHSGAWLILLHSTTALLCAFKDPSASGRVRLRTLVILAENDPPVERPRSKTRAHARTPALPTAARLTTTRQTPCRCASPRDGGRGRRARAAGGRRRGGGGGAGPRPRERVERLGRGRGRLQAGRLPPRERRRGVSRALRDLAEAGLGALLDGLDGLRSVRAAARPASATHRRLVSPRHTVRSLAADPRTRGASRAAPTRAPRP